MKTITRLLIVFGFAFIQFINAQHLPLKSFINRTAFSAAHENSTRVLSSEFKIPGKKTSQYTAEDWEKLIDSTWGPGQTAEEQLAIFDTFWDKIDQQWAGFPNIALNWDSLQNVYRPQIGSGLSRGRFYSLMSRMGLAPLESHTYIIDYKVDTIFGTSELHYKSGVPLLIMGTGGLDLLGAAVTPMQDSSSLVYRTVQGNPLGLEPGDLVLGFDAIPWKRLYSQLIDNGVPVSRWWSWTGSTPESRIHTILSAVGSNWGMFDTIDIVKYSNGDTLHLPTSSLGTFTPTFLATDQVPIAGVSMPQVSNGTNTAVSWGVVQGTNIGYVYVWDWYTASTPQLFHDAIYDLRNDKNVEGLVIDFRMNSGGDPSYANGGLSQLFNYDPALNMSIAKRNNISDHMSFSLNKNSIAFETTPNLFDRPIAVLIGPACLSAGDFIAFFMRFHPMTRFFGKSTNGAFVGGNWGGGTMTGGWEYQIPTSIRYSNVFGEGYLIHKGVQPDEEVWLTRDGVANGKDDVVEHALAWINGLSYTHDIKVGTCFRPNIDTVNITALVVNPQQHNLAVWLYLSNRSGLILDSTQMFDDGLHNDGETGDSLYGCNLIPIASEGVFAISVRTTDVTAGTYRYLPNVGHFFTNGPVVFKNFIFTTSDTIPNPGEAFRLRFRLGNIGTVDTVRKVEATVTAIDTSISLGTTSTIVFGNLPPGKDSLGSFRQEVKIHTSCHSPSTVRLLLTIFTEGVPVWTDTISISVYSPSLIVSENTLPAKFSLNQNYPNPFNPNTTIEYSIPKESYVSLKIFDLLGREAATMVSEKEEAGNYSVRWNAATFTSGIYFYQLQADEKREIKKMTLLK